MISLVMLTFCTYASCQAYVVDKAESKEDAYINMEAISDDMANAWADKHSEKSLQAFLDKYNIQEDTRFILDYDFTVETEKE